LDERRRGNPAEDCTPDDKPDPDPTSKRKPRKLLVTAPLIEAEIDIHAAMFGNHDLTFRHVWIKGGTAILEQPRDPYPLHAHARRVVSIITAFYPRLKAGFRAGIYAAEPPPKFDVRDFHITGLKLYLQFAPFPTKDGIRYGLAAEIDNVEVDAQP